MTHESPSNMPPRRAATEIVRALRAAGHVAYFAGGCVRDELLGLEPADYDVATDAPPVRISSLFKKTSEVGAAFGVVLVKAQGETIEVATFRSEGPYSDRRRPDTVHFSDAPTDARRRDFTINALFLDPLDESGAFPRSPRGGRVVDYVGGMDDLERRVLRAVGDAEQRLAEDHLRALRAVRLTARLGLALDPATANAIARHARELAGVSRERIGDELRKMLTAPSRAGAVRLLCELGLDGPVLEEPGRTWESGGVLAGLDRADLAFSTALAAWALDRGVTDDAPGGGMVARRWRAALCLSNEETEDLKSVVAGVGILTRDWAGGGIAFRKRIAAKAWFEDALRVLAARDPGRAVRVREDHAALARTASGITPPPLLTGDDLVAAGFEPGPAFKRMLDAVYDAQLEERVRTREEALALARHLAGEGRSSASGGLGGPGGGRPGDGPRGGLRGSSGGGEPGTGRGV